MLPRELVVTICRLGWQRGYLAATDGNVSMRLGPDRVLITPSGRSKALVEPQELLEVDLSGRVLDGRGRPSTEMGLHLAAYRLRPEVGAVVHAHPPLVCALSAAGRELDLRAIPEALLSLGRVPVVPYASPGILGGDELVRAVEPYLADHDALVLAQHGSLTLGANLEGAWARTEKLEAAARLLLAAEPLGGVRPLPVEEQRRLLAAGGRAPAGEGELPHLEQRIELVELPLTAEFAVEKRHQDHRGEAHLIVDDRPLRRVAFLTLQKGAGHRGGHVHRHKHEGFYVVSGRALVELACAHTGERLELRLGPGARLWLPPGVAHRISALDDLAFVEFTDQPYDPDDDQPFEF